ncbi:hypothetical protein EJK17_03275 [Lactobacillus xujianguonis]|uniref:Uncharacterized protein n=2 Tax=Lactobacillus xujianguonis TaxID=2495899 RepID=A0A437SWG6_9LACO|nr:hypothetical protein EJK17_03275 [Lactobacillus xujianguonis]
MMKQHMLQFRLNDKQWQAINGIRNKHHFDNNGELFKFLFFNALIGMQKNKELTELRKLNQKIDKMVQKQERKNKNE